jgi:dTMP kinase
MSQAVESSVVVSLEEIMRAEKERLRAEAEARVAKRAAELAARESAEREKRETELRRLEQEHDRRWREECREREELARLEAIRTAEVEKVRREADLVAQQVALHQGQRSHDNDLIERLHLWLRLAFVALAATIAVAAAAGVATVAVVSRRADVRFADLSARYGAAQDAWAKEREALALQIDKADQRAIAARERAENAERDLEALKGKQRHAPPGGSVTVYKPPPDTGSIKCQPVCPRGDPLCVECRR